MQSTFKASDSFSDNALEKLKTSEQIVENMANKSMAERKERDALQQEMEELLQRQRDQRDQTEQRREEDEDAVCDGTPSQVSNLHFLRVQAGENYLPIPLYRHFASFLSVFKLLVIGLIIIGKDPFALFGMQAPGIWEWGQGNKIYACMMVFFLSNMIENQLMSTGAFEITLNDVPVWSKLESGHLPSMQQLVQILDNEMKMNVHMNTRPHHHS
ncbi:hypothetical protein LDENG_00088830 [Scomber scombrus]|uniref:Selenoprotein T n=1 Tax=Scomber scombrus TaxID=13677 RepID=A0AAV1PCQ3_SCOSC